MIHEHRKNTHRKAWKNILRSKNGNPLTRKKKPKINRVSFGRIYSLNILHSKGTKTKNGLKLKQKYINSKTIKCDSIFIRMMMMMVIIMTEIETEIRTERLNTHKSIFIFFYFIAIWYQTNYFTFTQNLSHLKSKFDSFSVYQHFFFKSIVVFENDMAIARFSEKVNSFFLFMNLCVFFIEKHLHRLHLWETNFLNCLREYFLYKYGLGLFELWKKLKFEWAIIHYIHIHTYRNTAFFDRSSQIVVLWQ